MTGFAIMLVRGYQRMISPLISRRCRFHPTCSEYAVESIRMYGAGRGLVLAGWRLLRCNPWNAGGVDRPADQHLFGAR